MEEKYSKFYKTFHKKFKNDKNLIHCFKLLSNGGVISNGAFIRQKITVEFTLVHRTNKLIPLKQLTKRQIAIHKLITFIPRVIC